MPPLAVVSELCRSVVSSCANVARRQRARAASARSIERCTIGPNRSRWATSPRWRSASRAASLTSTPTASLTGSFGCCAWGVVVGLVERSMQQRGGAQRPVGARRWRRCAQARAFGVWQRSPRLSARAAQCDYGLVGNVASLTAAAPAASSSLSSLTPSIGSNNSVGTRGVRPGASRSLCRSRCCRG